MSDPMSPPPVPGQKKMSALGWIAIGCGAIAILCILALGGLAFMGGRFLKKAADNPAFAAAKIAVQANPDLEVVESDEDAGTLTVKNTKTGEVVTWNAKDIQDGKLTVTTKEGTTTIDGSSSGENGGITVTNDKGEKATFTAGTDVTKNLPSWLPTYAGGQIQGAYDATTAEGRNAMFTVSTSDSVDQVAAFYKSQLEAAGLKVEQSSFEANGQKSIILAGKTDDDKRNANVTIGTSDGKTQAAVSFNEKN